MASFAKALLLSVSLGAAAACKKAPTESAQAAPVASAAPSVANVDLNKAFVGRWIEVRDWAGHVIRPEYASVEELRADGTYIKSLGTYHMESKWRLTEIKGNEATFHDESTLEDGKKYAAEPRRIMLTTDGAIEFPSKGPAIRWVRQDSPPPPVKTSAEMTKFMALLDGKPGAGARAVKAFGSPSATDALRDFAEGDYLAVRVVEAKDGCYVLLANEVFLNVCWKAGKVVSAAQAERW